jgi:hypothetical protein
LSYLLLDRFRSLFDGEKYRHRDSSLGDSVAQYLPEDLHALSRSPKLHDRIARGERVLNTQNRRRGVVARRGDGTFGELIPGTTPMRLSAFGVSRGPIATVEIGTEVKILFKAMIKQIDRVMGNMLDQVVHFHEGGGKPICVGIVGLNHAPECTSYEGDRPFPTDGRTYTHPIQEAADAEARILSRVKPKYDELLFLRFRASNVAPYPFEWVDERATELDYAAILTRVTRRYDDRF